MRIEHIISSCLLALTSATAIADTNSTVLVTTQFAVPVGVPVAPYAPTYYSYQASRSDYQAKILSKAQEDELVQRIALQVAQNLKQERIQKSEEVLVQNHRNPTALTVLQQRCVKCHNQDNEKGQLNLDVESSELSREVRQKSLLRVLSTDSSRRMPKGQPPLSEVEFKALFHEFVR